MRKGVLLATAVLVLFSIFFLLVSAAPGLPSCGDNITDDLTLIGNLLCDGTSAGLIIDADNIVLDCNGSTIDGNPSYWGIENNGFDNVTVKNCIITNFDYGIIYYDDADYGLLENNTVTSNSAGFFIGGSNNIFANNTASSNTDYGFTIAGSNNVFTNNIVSSNAYNNPFDGAGIKIWSISSLNNTFTGNTISGNSGKGISILSSTNNTIENNVLSNNNPDIYLGLQYGGAEPSLDNTFRNIQLGSSYPTNISFSDYNYSSTIEISGVESPPPDDSGLSNIGKYFYYSGDQVYQLNVSYAGATYSDESALELYLYNDDTSSWGDAYSSLDTDNDIVYANINQPPGQYFAIMQTPPYCGGEYGDECECGDTVLGDATLSNNLTCEGAYQVSYALAVGAESITLDCNGSSITGNGIGMGVKFSGVTGATIKNCEISGFGQGILSGNAITSSNYILNNTLYNNSLYGIAIRQASGYTIQDNKVSNSSIGIRVVSSSGNIIYNNTIINPLDKGISIYNADSNTITDNTVQDADVDGIYLYSTGGGSDNTVQGNTVSLSETDVLSKHGIVIEDDSNQIYDNTVDCTSINQDYTNTGIWISGEMDTAENNILSGNEIYNCYYGLDASGADYFEVDNDDYHDNTYGAFLQGAGTSSVIPLIENSRIYNNSHGVYVTMSSYAGIADTNFTNNIGSEGGPLSGIHVSSDSTAYVTNCNFISNGEYGIYDEGPDRVEWILTEDAYCTDNNITISDGLIISLGGEIIAENCIITVNGEEMNLSGGQTGSYSEPFDESIDNIFGNSSYGVEGELHTVSGTYTGDLVVNFYEENPGGSGFLLADFGLWVDATLSPPPADLQWWILKIFYTDEELAASGLDEGDLIIQFYNATDDTWTTELDQGVNESGNYVWANLTHFSIFGIFEGAPVTALAAATEGTTKSRMTKAGINGYGTYSINDSEFRDGYSKELGIGGTIEFKINNQPHNITLKSVNATTATIEVSSTLQQATLKIGEEKRFDVSEDNVDDLSVTLDSIEGVRASMTVKYLPSGETTPTQQFEENLEKSPALKILGIIILIFASIVIIKFLKKAKKKN